jgi:hypothetical protein
MIAAIYARKSTEQTGMADDAKSVARQRRELRRRVCQTARFPPAYERAEAEVPLPGAHHVRGVGISGA